MLKIEQRQNQMFLIFNEMLDIEAFEDDSH